MPFLLLLVLVVACLVQVWPPPPGEPTLWWAVAAWAPITLVLAATAYVTRRVRRALLHNTFQRDVILQGYGTFRSWQVLVLIAAYFLSLYVLRWGWAVEQIATVGDGDATHLVPGAELLVLLPFLVGLLGSWACYYEVERTLQETMLPVFATGPSWGRWSYVAFHARQNFALVAAPAVLMVGGLGILRLFPDLQSDERFAFASFGFIIVVFICLPLILRVVLGLRPLPAGPLRDRLVAAAQRLRFRCSDILLWNTRSGVANALVVGILPQLRYVILSDRLVDGLSADEVEAVFGHEVGHVKHYHMPYYLGFMLVSIYVLRLAWLVVADAVLGHFPELTAYLEPDLTADMPMLAQLPLIGLYIFVVFGFLSRRCERQADIYGCRAVSCERTDCAGHAAEVQPLPEGRGLCPTGIHTFIRALDKVAHLNGISRSKPGWLQSWQHSTIARRVEFLQQMLKDPALEPQFQKRVGQVKWVMLMGLGALLLVLGLT
jgi:Zn-dependent protease with chaperone function